MAGRHTSAADISDKHGGQKEKKERTPTPNAQSTNIESFKGKLMLKLLSVQRFHVAVILAPKPGSAESLKEVSSKQQDSDVKAAAGLEAARQNRRAASALQGACAQLTTAMLLSSYSSVSQRQRTLVRHDRFCFVFQFLSVPTQKTQWKSKSVPHCYRCNDSSTARRASAPHPAWVRRDQPNSCAGRKPKSFRKKKN